MEKINIQFFVDAVYPVHNNVFKFGAASGSATIVKGLENFGPKIDGNVETWYDMVEEGWQNAMLTGKAFTIDFSGKRVYGDTGSDYIAGKMMSTGSAADGYFEWTLPSGAKLEGACVINVTTPAGGDTINVDSIEFQMLAKGKPTFTAAT